MANGEDLQSKAADLVKKVLTVGVGAAFLTEESLRSLVSEIKLPKELIAGILETAGKTKNEFLSKIGTEVVDRITARVEPDQLIREILEKNELELQIRLRFHPRSGGKGRGARVRDADSAADSAAATAED
jgi:hypothetical protein